MSMRARIVHSSHDMHTNSRTQTPTNEPHERTRVKLTRDDNHTRAKSALLCAHRAVIVVVFFALSVFATHAANVLCEHVLCVCVCVCNVFAPRKRRPEVNDRFDGRPSLRERALAFGSNAASCSALGALAASRCSQLGARHWVFGSGAVRTCESTRCSIELLKRVYENRKLRMCEAGRANYTHERLCLTFCAAPKRWRCPLTSELKRTGNRMVDAVMRRRLALLGS